jgi:hypothetical protein
MSITTTIERLRCGFTAAARYQRLFKKAASPSITEASSTLGAYGCRKSHDDTDLTDAARALVEPILPAARPGSRPRTTDLRAVMNAIFYLLRTGCQWRLLLLEFPLWTTVYHYFRSWENSGTWSYCIVPSASIPVWRPVGKCAPAWSSWIVHR